MVMTCTHRLSLLALLTLSAVLPARLARAEAGQPCPGNPVIEPAGGEIPANLPALTYTLPSAVISLAQAQLKLHDGVGNPVPFTVEGTGPRFVLRLGRPLEPNTVLTLEHTLPCSNNPLALKAQWSIGPQQPMPTTLGTVKLSGPYGLGSPQQIVVELERDPSAWPFLGAARYTAIALRDGVEIGRKTDLTFPMTGDVTDFRVACASAADSGTINVTVQAHVPGLSGAASAPLVAHASMNLTCPVIRNIGPDSGAPVAPPPPDGGVAPAPEPVLPDGGIYQDVEVGAGATGATGGTGGIGGSVVTPDASPDTASKPSSPGSCSIAAAGALPWWASLVGLAALLRLRRRR